MWSTTNSAPQLIETAGGGVTFCCGILRESRRQVAQWVSSTGDDSGDEMLETRDPGARRASGADSGLFAHHPSILPFLDTKRTVEKSTVRCCRWALTSGYHFPSGKKREATPPPYDIRTKYGKPFANLYFSLADILLSGTDGYGRKILNARVLPAAGKISLSPVSPYICMYEHSCMLTYRQA